MVFVLIVASISAAGCRFLLALPNDTTKVMQILIQRSFFFVFLLNFIYPNSPNWHFAKKFTIFNYYITSYALIIPRTSTFRQQFVGATHSVSVSNKHYNFVIFIHFFLIQPIIDANTWLCRLFFAILQIENC